VFKCFICSVIRKILGWSGACVKFKFTPLSTSLMIYIWLKIPNWTTGQKIHLNFAMTDFYVIGLCQHLASLHFFVHSKTCSVFKWFFLLIPVVFYCFCATDPVDFENNFLIWNCSNSVSRWYGDDKKIKMFNNVENVTALVEHLASSLIITVN
jgi:hypothetical protein